MRESHWPLEPLSQACTINPRLPRSHGLADDHVVTFVPMAAIDEIAGKIANPQAKPFVEVKKGFTHFENGDVLFAKITPCMENGKAAIARELLGGHGFGSTEFHVLRTKARVLPEWVFYFVRRQSFRMEAKRNFTGTAGQQRVPTTFMESTILPVPPLEEQRRIVDILSHAESIVRLRREAQRKAAEIIPALFLDMFGDPATNPKGWPAKKLGKLVSITSGGTPSKACSDYWNGTLPWVSPKDMKTPEIFDSIDHINDKVLSETNMKLIPIGTVLIVVRGMILVHTVPVASPMVPITINQDMKAMAPCSDLSSSYLLWLLRVLQPYLLEIVTTAAHGTRKLDTARLEELVVPLPSLHGQRFFEQRAEEIRSIQAQQTNATQKAVATFDALLARAFCGS